MEQPGGGPAVALLHPQECLALAGLERDLAVENPELATALSPFTGERVNRFLHVAQSAEDLVMQNKMQRRLGQLTGT